MQGNRKLTPDELLAEEIGQFYADPLGFVMFAYPWDSDPALQMVTLDEPWASRYGCKFGPDAWACAELDAIGEEVKKRGFDGSHAVEPILRAIASGHGIGKSAKVAWIVGWIMSTRPYCKGIVTANTAPQLETKTWAEVAKWTRKCITGHWFDVSTGKGSMKMVHKVSPESWRCDAQTCREENSEAFAGLHAANSTPFFIFDEASKIPDKIWEVASGGTTDGEPMWFAYGNPTQNSGRFKECFGRFKHRWTTKQIDSRTVKITNKGLIDEWIADYGIDSDYVKVRVRGMFPSLSVKQFISTADVDKAYGREIKPQNYDFAPKILTCDPAWEGDDMLEIGLRQGLVFKILRTIPKNDNDIEIANMLARFEDEEKADAVFIDGGYGTGIISAGRTMGRTWQIVWFASASPDPGYLNLRAYMWGQVKEWLKNGGCIPANAELHADLTGVETVPRMDGVVQLESKKDMKKRGLGSPGKGDALAISFAYPVAKKQRQTGPGAERKEYDPLSRA